MKQFATPEAGAMLAVVRDMPKNHRLEVHYSPDEQEAVYCTTEEREEFEQEAEIALTADVIDDQDDYDALVRWLSANAELGEV